MMEKENILEFYWEQYLSQGKKRRNQTVSGRGYEKRIILLCRSIARERAGSISISQLENYHQRINNLIVSALRHKNKKSLWHLKEEAVVHLSRLDLGMFAAEEQEGLTETFFSFAKRELNGWICIKPLYLLYAEHSRRNIRKKMMELVPLKPEMEFLEAYEMKRHFVLHIGPTNSGKTYHALERLKGAKNGIYLGPLRLLALEIYEKMKEYQTPCTMLTGQECIEEKDSRVISSTIEMLDLDSYYDIAVIDEAQMIADTDRGHSWTRAFLGLLSREIHVCMSPDAEEVICHLITLCNDDYEIRRYERRTELLCEDKAFLFPDDVRDGDALIVFSKKSVLDVAGRLEEQGISSSVIYGSLPPEIRRRQMRLFADGQTQVVVSTDAIGMGLNLPVRRIVFIQTDKFDGARQRKLQASEVKQIAGRAGRYGLYDTGYVTAMGEPGLEHIKRMLHAEDAEIEKISLGFPQVLLNLEEPLDVILTTWHMVEASKPFEKINIEETLFLYKQAEKYREMIDGFENKHILYRMITCPIDIKNVKVVSQWLKYCMSYSADVSLQHPNIKECGTSGILTYETYYKELELYYQFSKRFGKNIDERWLVREREKTEFSIMQSLAKGKRDYIVTCRYCGRLLPVGYGFGKCRRCRELEWQKHTNKAFTG